MIEFPGARDELGKKEIQRLCCFRIDDDDDGPKMLNINFVFKLSNCFISLTLSANKKPVQTTLRQSEASIQVTGSLSANQRPVSSVDNEL